MALVVVRAWEGLLDFVFPRCCAGCGRQGTWLCTACGAAVRAAPAHTCPTCARTTSVEPCPLCASTPGPDSLVAAYVLDGPLREAVHRFKYGNRPQLAAPLGGLLLDAVTIRYGAIVPVPLHRRRERQRGYNQAALLAGELAAGLGRPLWPGLARVRPTPSQVGRGGDERRAALAGAFRATGAAPGGVVLVDDVVTTGATLVAAAGALRAAGARTVAALALALG